MTAFNIHNADLIVDDEAHTYTFKGVLLPGVTSMLRPITPDFSKYYTPESRARGTKVHRMVQYDIEGTLDFGALDDELLSYYEGWQEFRLGTNFVPQLVEQPVFSESFYFAGRLDLFGLLDGEPALIDIKTGVVNWRTAGPQTAAYKLAAAHMGLIPHSTRRYVLDLKPGRASLSKERTSKLDKDAFLRCVFIHAYNEGRYDHEPF